MHVADKILQLLLETTRPNSRCDATIGEVNVADLRSRVDNAV